MHLLGASDVSRSLLLSSQSAPFPAFIWSDFVLYDGSFVHGIASKPQRRKPPFGSEAEPLPQLIKRALAGSLIQSPSQQFRAVPGPIVRYMVKAHLND
jgi:hypothetical protein